MFSPEAKPSNQEKPDITAKDVNLQYAGDNSSTFGNQFIWDLMKGVLIGALGGSFLVVVNEGFRNKGRAINKYKHQLRYEPEGMEEQIDLCKLFHILQERYAQFNEVAYRSAFYRCTSLCTIAEEIASGLLNGFIDKVNSGEMDVMSIKYDDIARRIWYEISDQLKDLVTSVREHQQKEFIERDQLEREFNKRKEEYKQLKLNWDEASLQAKRLDMSNDDEFDGSMASLMLKSKTTALDKLPPPPPIPIAPPQISTILQADDAQDIVELIDAKTLLIFRYIQDSVKLFREKVKPPLVKK